MNLVAKTRPTTGTRRNSAVLSGVVSLVCIVAPLTACSSSSSPAGTSTAGNIMLLDENNYSSTSKLTLPAIDAKAATDLNICWTELLKDLQCHDMDPQTDIDNISLIRFPDKTREQVQETLISGELQLGDDVDKYYEVHTDHSTNCTTLGAMAEIGGSPMINIPQDYIESTDYTYVLIAAVGTTPGVGASSMVFLNPTTSDNTDVSIPAGCNNLAYTADLHSLTKLVVSAQGPWVVDWGKVTHDSEGHEVIFAVYDNIDLIIGFYQGKTVADLENEFFDIEIMATDLYQIKNIPGTTHSAKLKSAQNTAGDLFSGFDRQDGVWALGLRCPSCQNPAPIVLTIVDPIGGDQ